MTATDLPAGLPSCALVDLDAISDNVTELARRAAGAAVMAVVKADGYGHGMVPAARAALAGGAQWLGVAQLGEALALRQAGLTAPVLAWLAVPGDRFAEAVAAGIEIGVSAGWALDAVAAAARATGTAAGVHLKADTGLGRGGATAQHWPDLVDRALALQAEGMLTVTGLWSHLACADEPDDPSVAAQVSAFAQAVELAERRGARPRVRHLANSAATLTVPQARWDVVRPGLAVYGLSPIPDRATPAQLGLRPAMTVAGRLSLVKRVPAGQGVSYGLTYRTPRETTLGLVPLGYGDGLPRHAGNRGEMLVGGRRRRIAGRVCMDQVVVDLDGDGVDYGSGPVAGDPVVVLGPGDLGEPTAQDWAEAADTISYEIVTRLGPRVPRVYVSRGGPGQGGEGAL